jgi:hypothetical protein
MSVKLYSTTGLQTLYGQLTNNTNTTHLTNGLGLMNDKYSAICNEQPWFFLEKEYSTTTVLGQQAYELPADCEKVKSVTVTVATSKYDLVEISSWDDWNYLNQATSWQSSFPEYYFVFNGQVYIWPTASANGNTVTIVYTRKAVRLSIPDHVTGTIVSITNGASTLTGNATSWTAQMVGAGIVITKTFSANTGDNRFYEIEGFTSATVLTLSRPYLGTTIAAGAATYTLGEVPFIPQKYAPLLAYYAAFQYWNGQDNGANRANGLLEQYNTLMQQMIKDEGQRASSVVVEPLKKTAIKNPNFYFQG